MNLSLFVGQHRRFSVGLVFLVGCNAYAGYVAPPYVGLPNSTSSTWNYNGDWHSGTSASHLTSYSHVDAYPLTTNDNGCGPGVPCLINSGIGAPLDFYIPNFVDPLPEKLLRIQYVFERSLLPDPGVQVIGFDPTVGSVLGMMVQTSFQTDSFLTNGVFLTYGLQDWVIHPNPDYERITITGAVGSGLREIKIDTISIPEPATLLLSGLAILGLCLTRRR